MTDKEKYISEKMRILVGKEGYKKPQAYQIAISMYNKKQKAQQGLTQNDGYFYQSRNLPQGETIYRNNYDPSFLNSIEKVQTFKGKGYGNKVQNVEDFLNTHSWFFDTDEKRNQLRSAIQNQGSQQIVKDFQNAYNTEVSNRARQSGMNDQEVSRLISEVGFDNSGLNATDGLFGAYTSSRPMFDYTLGRPQTVQSQITETTTVTPTTQGEKMYYVKYNANSMKKTPKEFEDFWLNETRHKDGYLVTEKRLKELQQRVNAANTDLDRRYNNEEAKNNPKAQARYKELQHGLDVEEYVEENKPKFQQAGTFYRNQFMFNDFNPLNAPRIDSELNYQSQDLGFGYNPNYSTNPLQGTADNFVENNPLPEGVFQDKINFTPKYNYTEPEKKNIQYYDTNRVNLIPPSGGLSLDYTLNYLGRGIGQKDAGQTALGAGLFAIKGARNFLTGYSTGKEDRRVEQEMLDKQFQRNRNYEYVGQQGGQKNSDILAQNAITDNPNGNINLEDGEFVLRNNGQVQPVVGDPHIKDGKIADGVNATLSEGEKVLSDYKKLTVNDLKQIKEQYNISLSKGTTFADAQKKLDNKLGISKLEKEKATVLEKMEKASKIENEDTRQLSLNALTKTLGTLNGKINTLSGVREDNFNFLFKRQEQQPKQGDGTQLFDKNGKEVTEVHPESKQAQQSFAQQGGEYITQLAKKHNIPLERAMQLLSLQEGGQAPQEQQQASQEEQIMQMVVGALQQGASPEEVVQMLMEQGLTQELAVQAVEGVMQQMQGMPQEEQMTAQQGKLYAQGGFTFPTRINKPIEGYEGSTKNVVDKDQLTDVELIQSYVPNVGYGKQVANVEDTIKVHDWYFDTEEKKNKFREASKKEGKQPEVLDFQKAYNEELRKRGKKAGLSEAEIESMIEQVGFSDKGVQKLDGLFGAFTSTRPLYDFTKKDGEVKPVVKDLPTPPQENNTEVVARDRVKNIVPMFEPYIPLISPMQPIAKQNVAFDRLAPIKLTPEPMLAEQERQRQTDIARIEQAGMSPQQQEALLAQGLATSQMSANDAISKVETWNAQNQFQTDQANQQIGAREAIMNAQFNADYQDKVMATLANQEETLRNMYRTQFLQGQADRNYITDLNKINATSEQFAITDRGVEYLNNKPYKPAENTELNKYLATLTPEQRIQWGKNEIDRVNKALADSKTSTSQQGGMYALKKRYQMGLKK